MTRPFVLVVAALLGCSAGEPGEGGPEGQAQAADPNSPAAPARYLFAWAGDVDRQHDDFLAVIDADPASARYGAVLATVPVGARGTHPHHTEHSMPVSRHLFANGFMAGRTFRFDLSDPTAPRLLGSFEAQAGFSYPHSYARLPDGNVLVTYQGRGPQNLDPGGLVEVTDGGEIVRSASAADRSAPEALIRPYSLAIVPELDRIVTTSYDMGEDMGFDGGRRGRTRVVQVWRLSDLAVLATLDLPPGPGGYEGQQPGEPRLLSDGRTVLVSTFTCGLYRMTGLAGEEPGAEFIHRFEGGGCAVPVVRGDTWIQPVPSAHAVVALDVSDPSQPREVSRVTLGPRNFPHWLALDPGGGRIVVADRGDGERRLFIMTFDPEKGALAVDREIDFDRSEWPHGDNGPARPHGTVFGLP